MGPLVLALAAAFLAMSVTTAGQVPMGYVRQAMIEQHDPMVAEESRTHTRSISWVDFSKAAAAAARPSPPSPQERAQWRQPPLASVNGANNNNNNNNHHPSARPEQRQQWPQTHAKWDEEFLPAQQHPAGSASDNDRFRYQHEPVYRSDNGARAVPLRGHASSDQLDQGVPSARRSSPVVTLTQPPVIVVQSDELMDEYDSSELFDDDQVEFSDDDNRSVAKSDVDDTVLMSDGDDDDDETDPMEDDPLVITARPRPNATPGKSSVELAESASKEWPASQENQASSEQPHGAVWQRYPQLLVPPTPPGKRVITAENHAPSAPAPKPSHNHRISYGLTAASYYARLQPSLKPKNGTGLRQRVIPRPYRRRPTSSTTTTAKPQLEPTAETSPEFNHDANHELDQETEHEIIDATREEDVMPSAEDVAEDDADYVPEESGFKPHDLLDSIAEEADDENDEIQSTDTRNEHEETDDEEAIPHSNGGTLRRSTTSTTSTTAAPSTTTSAITPTTTTPTTTTPKPTTTQATKPNSSKPPLPSGPVDIKELLRNAGPLSLSEILQQRGMSLAELLKGNGGNRIAPVIAPSGAADGTKSEPTTTSTTTTTTTDATTPARPDALPSVKPMSLKELLAAKNMSITDILKPSNEAVKTEKPAELPSPTLKPGVKRPVPFSPGRAKGLSGLVAPTAPPEPIEQSHKDSEKENQEPVSKPVEVKPPTQLKPLVFGGVATVDEALSSTTTTATSKLVPVQTKRPYVPGTQIGQYGVHTGRSYEEDEDEEDSSPKSIFSGMLGSYGNQRPIAISRLTPAPPRKSRPVLNFNYNELSEEEDEEPNDTTTTPILTHFNEEELKEDHAYFDLPISVRSAIIASSAVGGFCLLVFMIILTVFMVKQKTRIRLRHPAALFGMSTTALTPSNGSESSGITTPVSQPTTKGGYAKLPQRSSSLWGTLRRSVRQINSVHYS